MFTYLQYNKTWGTETLIHIKEITYEKYMTRTLTALLSASTPYTESLHFMYGTLGGKIVHVPCCIHQT
jgi:hypothetical protein